MSRAVTSRKPEQTAAKDVAPGPAATAPAAAATRPRTEHVASAPADRLSGLLARSVLARLREPTFAGRPNEDVLGATCWEALRASLGDEQPVFTVIKTLPRAALLYIVPAPPNAAGSAVIEARVTAVVRARGQLGVAALGDLLLALQAHGTAPGAVAALIQGTADFLAKHHTHLEEALWAARKADPEAAFAFHMRYSGAGAAGLALAKQEFATAGEDAAAATAITDFLLRYLAKGAPVLALARQQWDSTGGVAAKAIAEMDILARYNYDPALRAWADTAATGIAKDKVQAAGAAAETAKATAYEEAETIKPVEKTGKKNTPTAKRTYIKELKPYTAAIATADKTEKDAKEAAAAHEETWAQEASGDIEAFIAAATTTLGADLAAWLIKVAEGDRTTAEDVTPLFGAAGISESEAKDYAQWALTTSAGAADVLRRLVGHITAAAKLGIPADTTKAVASFLVEQPGLQAPAVLEAVGREPGAWTDLEALLRANGGPAQQFVMAALKRLDALKLPVKDLCGLCTAYPVKDVAWALGRAKGDLAEVTLIAKLVALVKPGVLDELLGRADAVTVEALLDKEPDGAKVRDVVATIDPKKVLALLTHGLDIATLKLLLIDDADPVAVNALETAMPDASAAQLKTLVPLLRPRSQLATVLAAVDAATAIDLLQRFPVNPAHGGENSMLVIGAHLSTGAWNRGTFPNEISSILYHYRKHNIDEHGPAADVQQYTAHAGTLYAVSAHQDRGDHDFVGAHGARGGHFTKTGEILTFWYS